MARPMTASPRSLLPSPAPRGMAPVSLALEKKKIGWAWVRPGHESAFSQNGPLRHLHPGLEHGLDQEFNSLDAQYDAASAYIKSQAHAGWTRLDDVVSCRGSTVAQLCLR